MQWSNAMNMTVQDILNLPSLYPLKLCGGTENIHRPVRWFYVAENEGIAEWIEGGEIVFVTGINYTRDENNLLGLLEQAYERNVAALVIMTGQEYIHEIPPKLISRANELGLPLIEQPYSLKMVEVTHAIGTQLVQFSQVKKSSEDVISQLLTGDFPSVETIQLRAKQLKINLLGRHVITVLRLHNIHALFHTDTDAVHENHFFRIKQQCYEALEKWSKQWKQKIPVIRQGDQFSLVLNLDDHDIDAWKKSLIEVIDQISQLDNNLKVFAGLSNEVNSAVAFQRGFWEASQAQEIAFEMQMKNSICQYRDLGVLKLLKAIPNKSVLQQFMHETLGILISDKKHPFVLLETLDAWLKENGNLNDTAKRLGIHRNTLNQRIQKIESLTNQVLTEANFRLNASMALLIWHMSH